MGFVWTQSEKPVSKQRRCSRPWQVWLAGGLMVLLLWQPAAAQEQSKMISEAIRVLEIGSAREACWRSPSAWRSIEGDLLPPASNPLAGFDFSVSIAPRQIQSAYDCSSAYGRPVDVGEVCIFQSDPAEEFFAGTNAVLRSVRALIHFEDSTGIQSIEGLLNTDEGRHSYDVVIPDLSDPYRDVGEDIFLSVFGCGSDAAFDRELFMTACRAVIELTTLDEKFVPGLALCESEDDVPVTPP